MRRVLSAFALLLGLPAAAQNTNCDTELTSQAEVDAFACTAITSLFIEGSSIENLTGLSELLAVEQGIAISNTALTSLAGLEGLQHIGGDLAIVENYFLITIDALTNLDSLGGGIYIERNVSIISLEGLNNISNPGGDLVIYSNINLTSLTGLYGIVSIGGDLRI